MSPEFVKVFEEQIAASFEAKNFLGSPILTSVCRGMAAEYYQDYLACDMSPNALALCAMRTQVLNEMYARVVAVAASGDFAAAQMAKAQG
jgi:hypothetical protein